MVKLLKDRGDKQGVQITSALTFLHRFPLSGPITFSFNTSTLRDHVAEILSAYYAKIKFGNVSKCILDVAARDPAIVTAQTPRGALSETEMVGMALSEQNRLEPGRAVSWRQLMTKRDPFKYFKTSLE
ncbi:MAG: hypothetical protein N2B03_06805, partial [Boseongicola sp.]